MRLCARGFAQISQLKRFVDCKRVGAGKLDKEQMVLNEVVTKGRLSQSAISHPSGEGVLGVGAPLSGRRYLQTLKERMVSCRICSMPRSSIAFFTNH